MKKYTPIILLMIILTAFGSCKKDEEENQATTTTSSGSGSNSPTSTIEIQNLTTNGTAISYQTALFKEKEVLDAGVAQGYSSYELVLYSAPIVGTADGSVNYTGEGEFLRFRFESQSSTDPSSTRDLQTAGVSGNFDWVIVRLGTNGNPYSFDGSELMISGVVSITKSGSNFIFTLTDVEGPNNETISGTFEVSGLIAF